MFREDCLENTRHGVYTTPNVEVLLRHYNGWSIICPAAIFFPWIILPHFVKHSFSLFPPAELSTTPLLAWVRPSMGGGDKDNGWIQPVTLSVAETPTHILLFFHLNFLTLQNIRPEGLKTILWQPHPWGVHKRTRITNVIAFQHQCHIIGHEPLLQHWINCWTWHWKCYGVFIVVTSEKKSNPRTLGVLFCR